MLKYIFLIGSETPMDLLTLSLFLKGMPTGELVVGVQRGELLNYKNISTTFKVIKKSGIFFAGYNVFLNMGRKLMFDRKAIVPDVETLQKQFGFPLFYFINVNDEEALSNFRNYSPDVIINHMPQVVRAPLINLFPRGVINIHPGLLPDYQGMGSCIWPLIDDNEFHGTTLHYIDSDKIDVGPIITSGRFPIQSKDSALSLHIKSRIIAATLANYVLNRLSKGENVLSKSQVGGVYHKLPDKYSLKRMRNKGHKYVTLSDRKIVSENTLKKFEYYDDKTGWDWKEWVLR